MKLPPILRKIHNKVTLKMSESKFVEDILIAKVTEEDGTVYDCIYCTIIRVSLIFFLLGVGIGCFLG